MICRVTNPGVAIRQVFPVINAEALVRDVVMVDSLGIIDLGDIIVKSESLSRSEK